MEEVSMCDASYLKSINAILISDNDVIVHCNEESVRLFGCNDRSYILNKNLWDLSPEKQPDGQMSKNKAEIFIEKTLNGDSQRFYWSFKGFYGGLFESIICMDIVNIKNRRLIKLILREITYKDNELQKNDYEKYKELFNNAPLGIIIADNKSNIIDVNPTAIKLLGYNRSELIGMNAKRIIHPEDLKKLSLEEIKESLKTGEYRCIERKYVSKSGSTITVDLCIRELKNISYEDFHVVMFMDITKRKKFEAALKESENRFRTLIESAPIGIMLIRDGKYIYGNPTSASMMGFSNPSDIEGLNALSIFSENMKEKIKERIKKLQNGKKNPQMEMEIIKKDGSRIWTLSKSIPITMDGKKTILIVSQDITNIKKVNKELLRSEKEKDLILNTTQEKFAYHDLDLKILWANKASGDSVGVSSEELIGRYCYEIWNKRDEPCKDCPIIKSRDTGKPQTAKMVTPNGRHWLIRGSPIFDENGKLKALVEFGQDITNRVHAESKVQAEKERAEFYLDLMAHDLGNTGCCINKIGT